MKTLSKKIGVGVGIVIALIGFWLLSADSNDHTLCQSPFIAALASHGCQNVDMIWFVGILFVLFGVALAALSFYVLCKIRLLDKNKREA